MNRWATLSSVVSGPCFASNGNLVVCTGSGHIVEFMVDNAKGLPQAQVLLELDGQPNSVLFEENDLIICDPSTQSLLIADSKKHISVLCKEYENEPFKGPSHCVLDTKGRKFFTDGGPLGDTSLQSPKGSLFCINSEGILRALSYQCLAQPSDLCLSPNGKVLYVAELFHNRILRFVESNTGLFLSSVFYQFSGAVGPTGIDCDNEGNLFVTRFEHKGLDQPGYLTVLDPKGKLITEISMNCPEVTGVAYQKYTNMVYITEASTNSIFQINANDVFATSKKQNSII